MEPPQTPSRSSTPAAVLAVASDSDTDDLGRVVHVGASISLLVAPPEKSSSASAVVYVDRARSCALQICDAGRVPDILGAAFEIVDPTTAADPSGLAMARPVAGKEAW